MKTKYIKILNLCLILFLAVILAYAPKSTVSAGAASAKDMAPTGVALSPGGSWFTDKSFDGLYMVYMPIVSQLQRVGEHLFIYYSGAQTFPADTPFHIVHGWRMDPVEEEPELFKFQLEVDGVYREEDFIETKPVETGVDRLFVFNFSEGMTGFHIFTGHWFAPCRVIYEQCGDPNEIFESRTSIVEVTFIP
jgi:hypothetical protein